MYKGNDYTSDDDDDTKTRTDIENLIDKNGVNQI